MGIKHDTAGWAQEHYIVILIPLLGNNVCLLPQTYVMRAHLTNAGGLHLTPRVPWCLPNAGAQPLRLSTGEGRTRSR